MTSAPFPQAEKSQTDHAARAKGARAPRALAKTDHTWNMNPVAAGLFSQEPFYCAVYRQLRKIVTRDVKTAACGYDGATDTFYLAFNPEFMTSIPMEEQCFVVAHELCHFVLRHVIHRHRDPPMLWNVATDLCINSMLKRSRWRVPEWALLPGRSPLGSGVLDSCEDERVKESLVKLEAKFLDLPQDQMSDYYFNRLYEDWDEQLWDGTGRDSDDDHDGWGDQAEGDTDRVNSRARKVVRDAIREAEGQSNGWGSVPSDMHSALRASVSDTVPWRKVLQNFVGTLVRAGRKSSIRKINKRFPMLYPGQSRDHQPRLLIAIDQSGSMNDGWVADIFAAIAGLSRKVECDIVVFDATVHEATYQRLTKGKRPPTVRAACGGTSFDAPTAWANDPRHRGKWDGLLVMTDGGCSKPAPSRLRRGWITVPGTQLAFDAAPEMVIAMDDKGDVRHGIVG